LWIYDNSNIGIHFIYINIYIFFAEVSNARNPWDYCNKKQLPPAFSIVLNPNGTLGAELIKQSHNSPALSQPVHQRTFNNLSIQPSSSFGVGLNIDLNKPPPEDDGN